MCQSFIFSNTFPHDIPPTDVYNVLSKGDQICHLKWKDLNGKFHGPIVNGKHYPAEIGYVNGNITYEMYSVHGVYYRLLDLSSTIINKEETHLPAHIEYYQNGNIKYKGWYTNGEFNRSVEQGPARIWYSTSGKILTKIWIQFGTTHRPIHQGPAVIKYFEYSNDSFKHYYENGVDINGSTLNKRLEPFVKAVKVIENNWKISKWNKRYREMLTQVLTVPANHDSCVGKIFPNGSVDYQKFVKGLQEFHKDSITVT